MDAYQTYAEQNAGKMRRYKITKRNAKHIREERIHGKVVEVLYGARHVDLPDIIDVFEITPEDAKTKYAHMGLLELGRESVAVADPDPVAEPTPELTIPDDWESMPNEEMKTLASTICGGDVTTVKNAKSIIEAYRDGQR